MLDPLPDVAVPSPSGTWPSVLLPRVATFILLPPAPLPQFLAIHGPSLLLDLPAPLYRPELEPYMAALMRHCLEDPSTLQASGAWA